MRILISPANRELLVSRGSEYAWAFHLARNLAKHGHTVQLVAGSAEESEGVPNVSIETVLKPSEDGANPIGQAIRAGIFPWKYADATERLLRKEKFDVLHHFLPFGRNSFNPLLLSRNRRVGNVPVVLGPAMVPQIADDPNEFAAWLRAPPGFATRVTELAMGCSVPLLRYLNRRTLSSVDVLVGINDEALQLFGPLAPQAKHLVIPAGVDTEHFAPLPRHKTEDGFTWLFVGNVLLRKGLDTLVRAFSLVVRSNPQSSLLIAGDGAYLPVVKEQVRSSALDRNVRFLGRIPQASLASVYASADAVINPTLYEPFGMVNLEAMACGRAVVTTSLPGMARMVPPDVGILTPPGVVDALATAMVELASDPERARRMGGRARSYVEENFSWEAVSRGWEAVYSMVAAAP